MKKTTRIIILVIVSLTLIYAYTHFKSYLANKNSMLNKAIPVSTELVAEKTVVIPLHAIGTVQAYSIVSIKSLVDGELLQANFKEGDFVKKGQTLFVIDPRPFTDELEEAQANLARDQAQLDNAISQVTRNSALLNKNYIAQQDFEQLLANKKALEGSLQADQAAVNNAQLQLSYSTINSPIDGRTGSLQVNPGNIIKSSNGTVLVTITQINPIYVVFSVPQQYLSVLQNQPMTKIPVIATLNGKKEQGYLSFIDNTIDTTTGTIQLKATFDNKKETLWPGEFVSVKIESTTIPNALLIPSISVQIGQNGPYVYVVEPNHTVKYQPIKLGPVLKNKTVILQGLQRGQKVVTAGQMQLSDGASVTVNE